MDDISPRSAVADPSGRLLELDAPGPRPVWAALDAAGTRRFTGELTLACRPIVRAYFNHGEVYYAERDGDPTISERLVEYGVLTPDELAAGTVQLGKVAHLGRLFDRVPTLDRDSVELVLEVVTGELLGEIADRTVESISVASYKHHPSGVSKWRRRTGGSGAPLTGEVPVVTPLTSDVPVIPPPPPHLAQHEVEHEPTAVDHQMVADYEQLMAATTEPVSIGEPTQQMVVPEALRILESPAYPPPSAPAAAPPPPVLEAVITPEPAAAVLVPATVAEEIVQTVAESVETVAEFDDVTWSEQHAEVEVEVEAQVEVEAEAEAEAEVDTDVDAIDGLVSSPAPFSFEFDLNKVLAQVALENDGLPFGPEYDDNDVDDDVRAAVRQALAEIEAATRPAITDGLSAVGFQLALDTAPDSPADIEAPGQLRPRLEGRALHFKQPEDAETVNADADTGSTGALAKDAELASAGIPGIGLRRLMGGTRKP